MAQSKASLKRKNLKKKPTFINKLLSSKRNQMLVFMAAFAVIGGFFLYQSFASSVSFNFKDKFVPGKSAYRSYTVNSTNDGNLAASLTWTPTGEQLRLRIHDINNEVLVEKIGSSPLNASVPVHKGAYKLTVWGTDGKVLKTTNFTLAGTVNTVDPADATPPSAPGALRATATSTSNVDLAWTASTDNKAVTSYRVYRDGVLIKTLTGVVHTDSGLTAATNYSYTVIAYDAAGNPSAPSNVVSVVTKSAVQTTTPSPTPTPPSPSPAGQPLQTGEFNVGNGITVPAGFPNPNTVGWKACGKSLGDLAVINGSYTTKTDGEVIDNKWIKGTLNVAHQNVTFKCSRVETTGTGTGVINGGGTNGGQGLKISYVEIIGPTGSGYPDVEGVRVFKSDIVVEYSDIHDVADAIILKSNMIVRYNYIHDLHHEPGSHSDVLQATGANNWKAYNNTFLAFNAGQGKVFQNSDGTYSGSGGSNAVVQLGSQDGSLTGFDVYNNYMAGGNYTLNANKTKEATYGGMTGTYRNNVFGPGMRYGTVSNTPAGVSVVGNTWQKTMRYKIDNGSIINMIAGGQIK